MEAQSNPPPLTAKQTRLGFTARILLGVVGLCVAVSLFAVFSPGGQPDGVGAALVVLFGLLGSVMAWSASLVLTILSLRAREKGSILTLFLNVGAFVLAIFGFLVAMEYGWGR